MQIHYDEWENLRRYLVFDIKIKDNKKNIGSLASRYKILCAYFEGKEFTRANFISFMEYMREKGYTTAYCNQFIKMARHIDKFYGLNEVRDFSLYPREKKFVEILTDDEMVSLAEARLKLARDEQEINNKYRCLIYLMYFTGARIGEILNLRWQDILNKPVHMVVYNQTKINDLRFAPIPEPLYCDLTALPHYSGYVFTNRNGHPLDISTVSEMLKKRAVAVGIKKRVYNHLFRHSFINLMLRNGARIHEVSRLVGHKSVETTDQSYVHVMIEELNDVLHAYHPALKKQQTLETITRRVRELCANILDTDRFILQVSKQKDEVSFRVKELEEI